MRNKVLNVKESDTTDADSSSKCLGHKNYSMFPLHFLP
jgi:hypothetical protein